MCLVLDPSSFSAVFKSSDEEHANFRPVKEWILKKKGFLVYGGSQYRKHLKKCSRYHGMFIELKKKGKAKEVDHDMVNTHQKTVERILYPDKKCDDTYIIAIFRVSGCRLFCSKDKKADKYIKNRSLYPSRQRPPKIYRNRGECKKFLCARYIVPIRNLV